MAILGTFVDTQTNTRAGDALAGTTMTTLAHSLPATNPEFVNAVLQSVEGGRTNVPVLFAIGGNASLLTIGFAASALNSLGASYPTISFRVGAQVYHSIIR